MKKLFAAVAGIALSAQAFALAPTETPDLELFISGASAQDKALAALVTTLCTSGDLDRYRDNANPSSLGKAHTSYFCTMGATAGLPAGTKVLLHKRSAGGSGQGVQPVADAIAIDSMSITNGNCTETTASTGNNDGEYECTVSAAGDLVQRVPDGGISDVEPAMFVGLNVPAGSVPVTGTQLAAIDVQSMNAVIFGIPVTNALYAALQEAQGLTPGATDEANMPSLSKSQVATIFSGRMGRWSEFKVNGVDLTAAVTTAPVDTKVQICRRVPGSGTQAQFNAKFFNAPCAAGAVEPAAVGNPFAGPTVTLNSGSGDVTACLDTAQTAGNWAVGIQSLEKNSSDWSFIKIDGIAPTLENVADNKYNDWVETSIQWLKTTAGNKLALLQTIASNASSPATIFDLNQGFAGDLPFQGAVPGAYLALTTNGHVASTPFDQNNPVATATHAALGTPNSCNTPIVTTSDSEL